MIDLPYEDGSVIDLEPDATELEPAHTARRHFSFSQLSMYLRCSWQYRFRYVLGMKEKPKVSLSIGSGGHAALEWNAKRKMATGEYPPVDEVVQKASDMMDHLMADIPLSEMEKDVEPGGFKDRQLMATKVFRVRDAPKITPIGAEVNFNLDVNEFLDEPPEEPLRVVNGKIDLVADISNELHVVNDKRILAIDVEDYKYVSRKKTQAEVNMSPQLTLYATVFFKLTGKWPARLGMTMLHPGTKADPPDAIPLRREDTSPDGFLKRMKRLTLQIRNAEAGIRAGVFIPVDDPITCSWCGYRDFCQNASVDEYEAAIIRQSTTPH